MNNEEIRKKEEIESALAAMVDGDFLETSEDLLAVLGYRSDRTANFPGTADDFIRRFSARNENTDTEQEFCNNVESVELVFQVTSEEIASSDQQTLFESPAFDEGYVRSFTFFAIELTDKDYPRGKYAQFTREVNKRFMMPIVVFFRVKDRLTIGFVGRRQHMRDPDRDVLEQVTLIKDIRLDNPHRAHIDILFELWLEECAKWMADHKEQENFDGLLAAWLARLDTEELNKKFYRELFNWFEWAVAEGKFPTDKNRTLKPEEHVIRLITRLLFVWFIKEKGLVADELFNEARISPLLKDYDRDTGDSYYRAVLQNLFFATLNTEIEKREFSQGGNSAHRNFSLYRYEDQMLDPDRLLALFAQTPFINGGLFDCLDSFKATENGGYRIDCFSDKQYKELRIPNRLFFDNTRGLIPLLTHYKFTVEENTPIEQEVALDPELLGKVFENLLAAYTPETRATVRKRTGSYYTPRPIVDYMVREALVAALAEQVPPTESDVGLWKDQLRYLLDYAQVCDDAGEWFDEDETDRIMRAISELKILDPAVGSGAFPMEVLHKLTLALRRLDPDNTRWEQLQRDRARHRAVDVFDTKDDQTRREKLLEIDETFKRYRDSDFGRKLYLIQNSIFGVDVQSIACQIAKLRFFISLTIEQEPEGDIGNNFGIKPLPNLETRFVAANTLIGLQLSETKLLLQADTVQQLIREIEGIREKRFLTNNRQEKLGLENQEDECREQLEEELESQREKWVESQQQEIERKIAQLPNPKHREQLLKEEQQEYEERKKKFNLSFEDARKIASWKSYDQNTSADWFDPEWMFGVRDGFDVVIGNPPYVESRSKLISDEEKTAYGNQVISDWGESLPRGSDLLIYFYPRSCKFLNDSGNGCFITQNAWLNTDYGHKFQQFSLNRFSFVKIIDSAAKFFSDTKSQNINAVITLFTTKMVKNIEYGIADSEMNIANHKVIKAKQSMKWGSILSMPAFYEEILSKMSPNSHISDKISFGQGLNLSLDQLSDRASDLSIIVKDIQFVSDFVDRKVRKTLVRNRMKKIPALIMPRGVGDRHYCTFNSSRAFSYSHVELYLPDDLWNSEMHYCLWLYLNSSFVWLFREITGRQNLGGGLLKAEATDMKMLPIAFDFDFSTEAKRIFRHLKNREPLPIAEEIVTEEHLRIDEIVANYFGFEDMEEEIRDVLLDKVNFRMTRAQPQK